MKMKEFKEGETSKYFDEEEKEEFLKLKKSNSKRIRNRKKKNENIQCVGVKEILERNCWRQKSRKYINSRERSKTCWEK